MGVAFIFMILNIFLFFLIDEQYIFYKRIMWVAWKLNVEILCNDVYMSAYPIQFLKFL